MSEPFALNQATVVILSAVFGLAGALKLLDRPSGSYWIGILGGGRAVRIGMRMLPFVELTVAGGLLIPAVTPIAARFALVLLIVFTLVLLAALRSGIVEPCGCFGETTAAHPSLSIARNALLIVAALVAVFDPPLSTDAVKRAEIVFAITTSAIAVIQSRRLEQLRRERTAGSALTHVDPLDVPVTLTKGASIAPRRWLIDGRHLLIVFVDPVCGPCRRLLPAVARWQHTSSPALSIAVVSRGQIEENRLLAHELALAPIAVQHDNTLARWFGIAGTPAALLLDPDGSVVQGPVAGARSITALAEAAAPELFSVDAEASGLAYAEVGR